MNPPDFDVAAAHRYFSADCFNRTWDFIDRKERSDADNEAMILCALASLWHWTQREDCGDEQLSIGYWQLSRVYALAGKRVEALRYAAQCSWQSVNLSAFYRGYALEAMARAASLFGQTKDMRRHLEEARALLNQIDDAGERAALEADLNSIEANHWEGRRPPPSQEDQSSLS